MDSRAKKIQGKLNAVLALLDEVDDRIADLDTNDAENMRYRTHEAREALKDAAECYCRFLFPPTSERQMTE